MLTVLVSYMFQGKWEYTSCGSVSANIFLFLLFQRTETNLAEKKYETIYNLRYKIDNFSQNG